MLEFLRRFKKKQQECNIKFLGGRSDTIIGVQFPTSGSDEIFFAYDLSDIRNKVLIDEFIQRNCQNTSTEKYFILKSKGDSFIWEAL